MKVKVKEESEKVGLKKRKMDRRRYH